MKKNKGLEKMPEDFDRLISDITIDFQYEAGKKAKVFVNNEDFTEKIRTEKVAILASNIAKDQRARDMLEKYQRNYLADPGLVADGRDMGTKVFSEANIKFFLDCYGGKKSRKAIKSVERSRN